MKGSAEKTTREAFWRAVLWDHDCEWFRKARSKGCGYKKFCKTDSENVQDQGERIAQSNSWVLWKRQVSTMEHWKKRRFLDISGCCEQSWPAIILRGGKKLTRYRYYVTENVDLVTEEAIFLSHEQGATKKGRPEVIGSILVDRMLRWRGQEVKVVVAENALVKCFWTQVPTVWRSGGFWKTFLRRFPTFFEMENSTGPPCSAQCGGIKLQEHEMGRRVSNHDRGPDYWENNWW